MFVIYQWSLSVSVVCRLNTYFFYLNSNFCIVWSFELRTRRTVFLEVIHTRFGRLAV